MSKSVEGSYKVKGYTTGDVLINSVTVTVANDGEWTFPDANGNIKSFRPSGVVAELLSLAFSGGGPATAYFK